VYEEFLEKEKKFAKEFLEKKQIWDNRFDEKEYEFIKEIFNDTELIKKIYEIIDDIIKRDKIKREVRFLVIGDFLFIMTQFNINNPSSFIFKITRDEYIRNLRIRAELNAELGFDYNNYIKMHKKLLIGLRQEKIIERTIIRRFKNEWTTIIYLKLELKVRKEKIGFIGASPFPFKIDIEKKYSIASFRNIWKVKRKRKEMEDFPVCIKSVIRANNIKFEISKEIYDINKEIIEKEKSNILNKLNCNSLEEYFKNIKVIINDSKYCDEMLKESKIMEVKTEEIIKLKISIKKEIKELMDSFQKIIYLKVLEELDFNKKYYLPCFIDNRGRQYYGSIISPTFNKIFRNLYKFFEKKKFEDLEDSKFYKKIMKYEYLIKNLNLNKKNTYIALVLLIEIGKNFIEIDKEHFINTEEFIKEGIKNMKMNTKVLKIEDEMYVRKIKNELSKLINGKEIDENIIIFKDATASGLQNYGTILGYRENMLSFLNLDGEYWCDTYQYLIKKFVKEENLLKRKYWKNTIMTIPYNSTWYSCFIKFLEKLREDGIEYNELKDDEKEKIKNIHKEFYDNIKSKIKKEFFKEEKGDLKNFRYNELKLVRIKEEKITYKRLRDKYGEEIYEVSIDEEATNRALEANNMHYLDALLVKEIMKYFDLIAIHDCFGIRLCELHKVIDKINEYYSNKIGKDTYSINIIK
jgi:hypothetical protein